MGVGRELILAMSRKRVLQSIPLCLWYVSKRFIGEALILWSEAISKDE